MREKILLLGLEDTRSTWMPIDHNLSEFRSRERLWNTPNLGLLTIAGLLYEKYEVTYADLNYDKVGQIDFQYVFMSPSTSQIPQAYKWAEYFKRAGTRVVMGGPHVTMMPDEALRHADTVFIGESENALKLFLANPSQELFRSTKVVDMKRSVLPRYELAKKYPYSSIPVQVSRGCPHQCEFCLSSTIYGRKVRRKSLDDVKRELVYIKQLYNNPFIFFTDDNFFIHQEYSLKMLELLQRLKLNWYAFTDITLYQKKEILKKLYKSGCRKLLIGFESLDENNLYEINRSRFKGSKIKGYNEAVSTIQSYRVGVVGSFVLGLLYDSADSFERLYEFIWDTCIYGTNITIATPFPGTVFYQKVKEVIKREWSLYDGFSLVYPIHNMTEEEFMSHYIQLINRINSKERIDRVIQYFKGLL